MTEVATFNPIGFSLEWLSFNRDWVGCSSLLELVRPSVGGLGARGGSWSSTGAGWWFSTSVSTRSNRVGSNQKMDLTVTWSGCRSGAMRVALDTKRRLESSSDQIWVCSQLLPHSHRWQIPPLMFLQVEFDTQVVFRQVANSSLLFQSTRLDSTHSDWSIISYQLVNLLKSYSSI